MEFRRVLFGSLTTIVFVEAMADSVRNGKRTHVPIGYDEDDQRKAATPLLDIANIADENDNCAIAIKLLKCGTVFQHAGETYSLSHTILEGHRFAIEPIPEGANLKSWSLPFGTATRMICPGEYCCNAIILTTLRARKEVNFPLPDAPNFCDLDTSPSAPFPFDENAFVAGKQARPAPSGDESLPLTFEGYARTGGRGVGTRNKVVLIGVTVASAGFVRALEARLAPWLKAQNLDTIDGIVSVAHNEGEADVQNNKELMLSTIAGFVVHPNTGAALVVATGQEKHITLQTLDEFMATAPEAYPVGHAVRENFVLTGKWSADISAAEAVVKELLVPAAAKCRRTAQPVSALRIALQCGGSDAFSGITGNPLVGEVAKLLLMRGGLALLAESPELVGAEPYILSNCRNLDVARKFLMMTERYKRYAFRHGQDANGNPSGGNLFRGLYNIVIKSLGASRKKPPSVCLDECVEYAERIAEDVSGYYFMDSPGNDLESIAGQVACGCNAIFFVTGNGAITNFPFVPTLKVVTTSGRFHILSKDMDVNAGLLNEGTTMDDLSAQIYKQLIDVCSGTLSKGESAGHSQVSIWRNWFLDSSQTLKDLETEFNYEQKDLAGPPLKVKTEWTPSLPDNLDGFIADIALNADGGISRSPLSPFNLVLPTSLCSSQIARLACDRLNNDDIESDCAGQEPCRFATLPHTEGCGGAGGAQFETIFQRVMVGHLVHPQVQHGFLLEHGCEKTHNDWFAGRLTAQGLPLDNYGWASVQLDGGIEAVCGKIREFFDDSGRRYPRSQACGDKNVKMQALQLGLLVPAEVSSTEAVWLAALVRYVIMNSGTVLLPSMSPLLKDHSFIAACLFEEVPGSLIQPTLAYAQLPASSGLHIVDIPATMSWVEVVSGLAPAVHCFVTWLGESGQRGLQPSHPFVPTVHVDAQLETKEVKYSEADVTIGLADDMAESLQAVFERVRSSLRGSETKACRSGALDFSVARGITGVSL
eukprot:TRINITY_DN29928_c0_g1_i1.p1 TRINITY_DN29928_c0_g1~~TRINITY_DN29928_c0_g1_i1.p1  ORF type:complete len:990 (-),score=155.38 TRINITY_DN29928_c0_g1_i1:257-3226(-)